MYKHFKKICDINQLIMGGGDIESPLTHIGYVPSVFLRHSNNKYTENNL